MNNQMPYPIVELIESDCHEILKKSGWILEDEKWSYNGWRDTLDPYEASESHIRIAGTIAQEWIMLKNEEPITYGFDDPGMWYIDLHKGNGPEFPSDTLAESAIKAAIYIAKQNRTRNEELIKDKSQHCPGCNEKTTCCRKCEWIYTRRGWEGYGTYVG